MQSEDLMFDIFACVSKNELEKSQLVSRKWRSTVEKGVNFGRLKQERVFTELRMTSTFYEQRYHRKPTLQQPRRVEGKKVKMI